MSVKIQDGWLYGTLPDDKGHEWPVVRNKQASTGAQNGSVVNLVLHTTETNGLIEQLRYPSNFQTGEGVISQHIKLGESGDAVWTYDRDNIGIEMVGHSSLGVWLPDEATLGPTVALVAWLDAQGLIHTGVKRPAKLADLPVRLDMGPQAVPTYYRRMDPTTQEGVYGHVDLAGGNSHWDPGSFNYPVFFERVASVMGDDEMAYKDFQEGVRLRMLSAPEPKDPGDLRFGWRFANWAAENPKVTAHEHDLPAHTHPEADSDHQHTVRVLGRTLTTSGEVTP